MPTGPGSTAFGEPEPDPADDGGAAVGTHDQQAALGGGALERDLLRHRHVVAEHHHVAAGVERVHRLDQRARPGHRDEHEAGAVGAGREAVVRRGASSRVEPSRRAGASAAVDRRDRLVEVAVVGQRGSRRRGRWRWCRRAASKPSPVEHLDVEGGRHRDLRGHDAGHALDVAADLQQRDGVGVRAGADGRRGRSSCGLPQRVEGERARPGGARRRSRADARAGRGPARARRRCRARAATRRTRAAPRRAARSRAGSRTAAWCGRVRRARPRRPRVSATPAARWSASQPASTSSPSGVRPSPRPSRSAAVGRRSGRREV